MTWTCEQTELRMSDYLDGLLEPAEQAAFDLHVNTCERCTPLVASVSHVLGSLHKLEQIAPSPRLVESILNATQGPQSLRKAKRWWHGLQSPRFVYSAVSVAATLIVLVSASGFSWRSPKLADLAPANIYRKANGWVHVNYAKSTKFFSDLRVVYEIQSRMNESEPNPATREEALPQNAPSKKDPGQTDNTRPGSPRQQNRANDIGRSLEVLACQFSILNSSLLERRVP